MNTSGESVPGTRTDHVKSLKGSGAGLLSEAQSAWTFHQEGKQADVKAERESRGRSHRTPEAMVRTLRDEKMLEDLRKELI